MPACHLQVKRDVLLSAAGLSKRVSRGSQGVGNSPLNLPKGIKRKSAGERGRGFPYPPEMERVRGRDWRKARFFLLLFLLKKK